MLLLKRLQGSGGKCLAAFRTDESGAAAIEYSLVASFILVALIVAMNTFGDSVAALYQSITTLIAA